MARYGRKRSPSGCCSKCNTWRQSLHRDHIIPKWKNGPDIEENVQYLCANCHEEKTWAERVSSDYKAFVSRQVSERMLSPAARQKISVAVKAANQRRQWTTDARERCGHLKGKKRPPFTPEHRARISQSRIALFAARRLSN